MGDSNIYRAPATAEPSSGEVEIHLGGHATALRAYMFASGLALLFFWGSEVWKYAAWLGMERTVDLLSAGNSIFFAHLLIDAFTVVPAVLLLRYASCLSPYVADAEQGNEILRRARAFWASMAFFLIAAASVWLVQLLDIVPIGINFGG